MYHLKIRPTQSGREGRSDLGPSAVIRSSVFSIFGT
jgi:hypothetical protein